jgi:DNA adenine methylase
MEPVVQWVGGKKRLLSLLNLFTQNVKNYHEIFLGGGALLLNLLPECSVSIEKNKNIFMIYENIKHNSALVINNLKKIEEEYLPLTIEERKAYYLDKRTMYNELTYGTLEKSVLKTAILMFLNKTCFNAVYRENQKGVYNVPFGNGRDCLINNNERIIALSSFLNKPTIKIKNCDFDYIKDVAHSGDLVYIDPPYYPLNATSFTSYTKDGFGKEDHDRLISLIKYLHVNGVKIVLSNSNNDYFKTALKNDLKIYEISISRTLNCKKESRGKTLCEMIATNIDISRELLLNYKHVDNVNVNVNVNVGDNLNVEIITKQLYFVKMNDSNALKIDKVPANLVNILANNKTKYSIEVVSILENKIKIFIKFN